MAWTGLPTYLAAASASSDGLARRLPGRLRAFTITTTRRVGPWTDDKPRVMTPCGVRGCETSAPVVILILVTLLMMGASVVVTSSLEPLLQPLPALILLTARTLLMMGASVVGRKVGGDQQQPRAVTTTVVNGSDTPDSTYLVDDGRQCGGQEVGGDQQLAA